jgi:hypothetical protein
MSGQGRQVEAVALAGVHHWPIGSQNLSAVWTSVLELLLLQCTIQVAADTMQLRRDGRLAKVCTHGLLAQMGFSQDIAWAAGRSQPK